MSGAANGSDSDGLGPALHDTVQRLITSTDLGQRQLAEQQLSALEVTDDYGVHLTEMTLNESGSLAVRQMAALLLKKYVDAHWSADAEKFRPPEATPQAKSLIRKALPHGLKESISKVRSSVAYTISAVAHWDWPEQWPELFDILMAALQDPNEFAAQGAVRVLKEFTRDLTDAQIPLVAPVILPDIYRIFREADAHSVRTRTRAIEIFTTLSTMICTIGEVNPSLCKSLLGPVLPTFTEALVAALNVPPESHDSDTGLKTEVLKALTVLVKNVSKSMAPWLPQILGPVWSTLTTSANKYVREIVNAAETTDDEGVDSDGEILGFDSLVFAIFEFVHALVETPKFRASIRSGLGELMYYIVLYMQITEEQCEKWMENPDQFVEDEDEDTFTYSVRISAQDLLMALCEEFEEDVCVALAQTIERHVAEAQQSKAGGNDQWWKQHEAAMLSLGSAQEVIERQVKSGTVKFDLKGFFENVVLADVVDPASPFLFGRCLWIASKFPACLSTPSMSRFLEATVRGLQPGQMSVVRISAARAVWGFCSHLRSGPAAQRQAMLAPVLAASTDALLEMAAAFNASTEVLGIILENLAVVLACDDAFTASVEAKVAPLAIAIFLKYNSDPVLTSLVQDLFKVLSQTAGCLAPLQLRLVPTLVSILEAHPDKVSPGMRAVALDVLQTLVRASESPLSDLLIGSAFPIAVQSIMRTDDNATMQSGGECLRSYLSVAADQICSFHDSDGKSGLWYMVRVAEHLLNPVGSEFTATFVGRLVTTLIQKTGDRLGTDLDFLLKAVLSKLQGSETMSVIQSLIMVYAHLIHSQLDAVLAFLCSVPGPAGETALQFVLSQWVSRQHLFYGPFETKVTIVALAKLLQHGVNADDKRLQGITAKGDEIVTGPGYAARTRSQKKLHPSEWTTIPVLAKILKLMIGEMAQNLEDLMTNEDDDDDDTEEEEFIDGNLSAAAAGVANGGAAGDHRQKAAVDKAVELSQLLSSPELVATDDDEDDDDPDAKSDPIYALNLKQYLSEFLVEFCRQPYFLPHFAPHLNALERSSLEALGVECGGGGGAR